MLRAHQKYSGHLRFQGFVGKCTCQQDILGTLLLKKPISGSEVLLLTKPISGS